MYAQRFQRVYKPFEFGVQLRSSDVSTAQELHLAPRRPRRGGAVVTSVITSVIAVLAVVGLLLALLRPAVFGMGETRCLLYTSPSPRD